MEFELFKACHEGDVVRVQSLLARGVDPNAKSHLIERLPLVVSVEDGHVDCAQLLLNAKANVNGLDMNGWTALMRASARGKRSGGWECMRVSVCAEVLYHICVSYMVLHQMLLNARANVDLCDSWGWTALHSAVFNGQSVQSIQVWLHHPHHCVFITPFVDAD